MDTTCQVGSIPNIQSAVNPIRYFFSCLYYCQFLFVKFDNFFSHSRFWDYMINEWATFICTVKSVYIGFTDSGESQREREREMDCIIKLLVIGKHAKNLYIFVAHSKISPDSRYDHYMSFHFCAFQSHLNSFIVLAPIRVCVLPIVCGWVNERDYL